MYLLAGAWRESCVPTFCTRPEYPVGRRKNDLQRHYKNTTAKLTSQHGLIYHKLIQTFGVDRAQQYLSANEAALQKYRELCRHIDCDFEEKSAYVYALQIVFSSAST